MQINLTPDFSLPVIILIFVANYFVVKKFFLQPINSVITEREGEISGAEKRYEEALARFNEAAATMEARLHQAKREGTEVRERHRSAAVERRHQVIEETRKEAEAVVGKAEEELGAQVAIAREKVLADAESLARLAAERILGRKVS